jgi:glycerate kinase
MAEASGLRLLRSDEYDPLHTTTYGTGELMRTALEAGCRRLIVGIGGSATNDGGAGMLQALGVGLYDTAGNALPPGGEALALLARLDMSGLDPRLAATPIQAMVDVNNPLCGPSGASYIFGPQKGATKAQVQVLDSALGHFADVCALVLGQDDRDVPGVGAAGGLGFAAKVFLKAALRPGFELIAEMADLHTAIAQAQLVFTGEGRLDAQTAFGKTPAGVVRLAHAAGVPVVAVAGALEPGYESLYECGLSAAFSLVSGPMTLQQAYEQTAELLAQCARDVTRLKFPL